MKIVHLNAVNGVLSTGRFCSEISKYLQEHGNESYVLYSTKIKTENSYKVGNYVENKFSALLSRLTGLNEYYSFFSTKRLIKKIKMLNPDIVHIHNIHANFVNINKLFKYLNKNNVPVVITLHDCWMYTGGCVHYTLNKCYKWQDKCEKCEFFKEGTKSYFFDKTKKMFLDKKNNYVRDRLYVVGVSRWITNEAKKSILKNANDIICIPNWIDYEKFYPSYSIDYVKKLNLEGKFIILGVASSWNKSKGIDFFVELASELQEDEIIVLLGNNPLGIEHQKILFINQTYSIEELRNIYSMANVFLQLSIQETFGLVVLEALACGVPVITNSYTANPDLIDSSVGIVLNDLSANNIYKNIQNVKDNDVFYNSDKCVDYVKKNFSKENSLNKYLSLYKKIIEK